VALLIKFYKPESIEESVQKNKRGLSTSQKIQTQLTTQKREERRGGIELVSIYVNSFMKLVLLRMNDVLEDDANERRGEDEAGNSNTIDNSEERTRAKIH
jgi:hypothetical protein